MEAFECDTFTKFGRIIYCYEHDIIYLNLKKMNNFIYLTIVYLLSRRVCESCKPMRKYIVYMDRLSRYIKQY